MQKVTQSMLAPAIIESRVIPNGIDLTLFRPGGRACVRAELGIPDDAWVILTTAAKIVRNKWKDYSTMRKAIALLGHSPGQQSVYFLVLGSERPPERDGRVAVHFIPYQHEKAQVVRYYQAADVYIHAAKADTFPNTVIEALACGIPVVATSIGGIPEQLDDGENGFLVSPKAHEEIATAIQQLLQNPSLCSQMSSRAAEKARRQFDMNRMADAYLQWYHQILSNF
jgi:glycosyltransferase involved in cell wall biosynthesis